MRAALKVHREWWTMAEAGDHFRLKGDLDLRRMVMGCVLRPAMYVDRELHPAFVEGREVVIDKERAVFVSGWVWAAQEVAQQYATFDCTYQVLRDRPEHDADAVYYALPDSEPALTLSGLLSVAVVFDENIAAIEAAHREAQRGKDEGLGTRADQTREKLLVGLAVEHLGWKPWEGDKAIRGLQDLHDGMAALGIHVSIETIKRHIKDSWFRVRPMEIQGKPALEKGATVALN